ncbi:hypothetical protein [Streptomyces sp. 8L]|uniref:hypothetical protein n=1 Tax=Streptomyces sp. 8L TaxID=2877242 RepID=UPI001CD63CE6|nr:hypothetical protein [Streptomyces sp. 8L]MCA1222437.1 hypothetical protein [Streptomyces sp. 8L]
MTTEALYRFHCDAPDCDAAELRSKVTDTPDGWTKLSSTDHIPVPAKSVYPARRTRTRTLSYSEQCRGAFYLHLCPKHPAAFNAHRPITNGNYTRPGRDATANVSCSCGLHFGYTSTGWRIAAADMTGPAAHTERAWWRHLPPELRSYATRDA